MSFYISQSTIDSWQLDVKPNMWEPKLLRALINARSNFGSHMMGVMQNCSGRLVLSCGDGISFYGPCPKKLVSAVPKTCQWRQP